MFKFQKIANVGDRIRAHDFHERTDCYVEGVITTKDTQGLYHSEGAACFVIVVDVDCWRNTPHAGRIGKTVYVPMQLAFAEWDGRIVKL